MGLIEEKLSTAYRDSGISSFSMDQFYKDCRLTRLFQLALMQLEISREEDRTSHFRDARFSARNGFKYLSEPGSNLIPQIRVPISLLQEDEFLDIVDDLKYFPVRISVKAGDSVQELHGSSLFLLLTKFIRFYAPHHPNEIQAAFENTRDYGIYLDPPTWKETINLGDFHFDKDMRLPWILHRFVQWGTLFKRQDSEIVICSPSLEEIKQAFPPDPNEEFFDTVSESTPPSKE